MNDIMWINGKTVFHVVDIETNFQNAIFIYGKYSYKLWNDFIDCLTSVYEDLLRTIRLDK